MEQSKIIDTLETYHFSHAKAGHECGEGCHRLWIFLAEVSGESLITDAVFKGREGFSVRTIDNLVLFN